MVATRDLPASIRIYTLSGHHRDYLGLFSFSPAPSSCAAFGLATHSPPQEPGAVSLGLGLSASTPPARRAPEAPTLSLWKPHVMFASASWVDMPPQHRQKGLPGKEWEGTSCFNFLLLPAWQGVGTAQSVSSGFKKMTVCSGDGSHLAGQLEELPVLASTLGAGLHLQTGSSSICVICE